MTEQTNDNLPLRRLARVINGGTPGPAAENWGGPVAWATPVDLGRVDGGHISSTERTISFTGLATGSTLLPAGSVLLSSRAPIGYAAVTTKPMALNQGCKGLIPLPGVDARFLRYSLQSRLDDLQSRGRGSTFLEVNASEVASTAVPSTGELRQLQIADYLDRETAEIDAFIAELGTLANLEDEKVQSISHSLLAAYEQNDWTPAHLGPLVVIPRGQVDPRVTPYNEMYLVAPNHIESRTGRILDLQTAADQGADSGKYLAEKGQVVFSKIRPTLMKAAIAPLDCLTSADMYPMEPNRKFISARFLLEFLLGPQFEAFAATESARVAMPKLNRETLAMAPLLLPPLGVQDNIVESLGAARAAAEYVKELVFSATELAKERRAALISAAVTGQIDVTARNKPAVEQLQDELEGK